MQEWIKLMRLVHSGPQRLKYKYTIYYRIQNISDPIPLHQANGPSANWELGILYAKLAKLISNRAAALMCSITIPTNWKLLHSIRYLFPVKFYYLLHKLVIFDSVLYYIRLYMYHMQHYIWGLSWCRDTSICLKLWRVVNLIPTWGN